MPELIPAEPGSPEWKAVRATGVTATDIGTILGLSPWDSAYSLYWRKLGQVPEVEDNDRFRLGRELESYVRERWAQAQDGPWHFNGGALYRHADRTWQMATPDYQVGPGLDYREPLTAILELKTSATHDGWGADGSADVPPHVRAQVLWQMDVMDVATGHVGIVFLPSGEFRSYVISHEDTYAGGGWGCNGDTCQLCADQRLMRAAGETFMAQLRHEIPPPDPDASEATLAAVRARFLKAPGKEVEVDGTLYAAWTDTKDLIDHYAAKVRGYESQLREQAGEASVYTVDGQPVARRIIVDAQVKAHTRHSDYLRRITPREDTCDDG